MAVQEGMLLHKEYSEKFDLLTGDKETSLKLSLSALQLQQGLIAELGHRNFSVLLALAAYSNQDSVAFPTVDQLTEITGIGRTSVIKSIQELEAAKVGGKSLFVKRKLRTATGNTKSIYEFITDHNKTEVAVKPIDYINIFCNEFEAVYGRPYVVNFGRDTTIIKSKLMAVFPAEDIPEIIRVAVQQYKKWANTQYPTPTIGMMTWLGNKAADEISKQRKTERAVQERIAVAEKAEEHNPIQQLDLL